MSRNHRKHSSPGKSKHAGRFAASARTRRPGRKARTLLPRTSRNAKRYQGILSKNRSGNAFVSVEGMEQDVFIYRNNIGTAMEGDTVEISLMPRTYWGKNPEGYVLEVLKRGRTEIAGTVQKEDGTALLIPVSKKDESLLLRDLAGAGNHDRVVAKITKFPEDGKPAEGVVQEILAPADNGEADILALIRSYGLPGKFSDEVEKEAALAASEPISEEMLSSRRDLRNQIIITIDGADSKDLDDAVSVRKLEDGTFELGVHIADVSHYVRRGTALNDEAFERGNSTYLLTRVIPMLPKSLSNGICSLFEGVDRLTLSCSMKIDLSGNILTHEIYPSVIRSSGRMIYDDVAAMLENKEEALIEKYRNYHGSNIYSELLVMQDLAARLTKRRIAEGSLDFDLPEPAITLDEKGHAVDVRPAPRDTAHRMIEEFMLAANRTVARHFRETGIPFVYRIHERPEQEKISDLKEFLRALGIRADFDGKVQPRDLARILEETRGTDKEAIVHAVVLRSMTKACYSTECAGHFGLAFPDYCHFTSPIRRYPDLMIHRIISETFHGPLSQNQIRRYTRDTESTATHASETEKRSQSIEREVDKMKAAEFMSSHIGETYPGIITGVTAFGFYVQLPNTVEGMVRLDSLNGDDYEFQENRYRLVGLRTGRMFSLADKVSVTVLSADPEFREIDFTLAEESSTPVSRLR